jgi:5-methylcytosine-specific restriction protein A
MPGRWAHLYETPRWRKMRATHLHEHPACVMCLERGWDTRATVVDHKQPHRGDTRLFFDPSNLQSLCKPHHDSNKQREERHGIAPGCDEDGNPIDPRHPWNQQRAGS